MFRLTREVRFSLNDLPDDPIGAPTNSYAGFPTHRGFGQFVRLQVTLRGELEKTTGYLRNIREIDAAVRERVIGRLAALRKGFRVDQPLTDLATAAYAALGSRWPGPGTQSPVLECVAIWLTPFLCASHHSEIDMPARLSQKFEFSASHRLHNPAMSDEDNRRSYGKCNNPHGHGHNYELQVTLAGNPNQTGLLAEIPAFERIVAEQVINPFDHKNLNAEVPEFRELIPSVENIAMVIFRRLRPPFDLAGAQLASVTVWETPKTWCEYSE